MAYVLLADSHTFKCRTWDDLAARLVWAREEGYVTAKARRANGFVHRTLLSSEAGETCGGSHAFRAQLAG